MSLTYPWHISVVSVLYPSIICDNEERDLNHKLIYTLWKSIPYYHYNNWLLIDKPKNSKLIDDKYPSIYFDSNVKKDLLN